MKIVPGEDRDHVDHVLEQWESVAPGVDRSPVAVIARLGRLVSYVDRELEANFARFGINRAGWDVLASLRRNGSPYRLTPTELYRALMRTSGAITNQLHRLEAAGLVRRVPDLADGRSSHVELTNEGLELIRRAGPSHLETEQRILAPLDSGERAALAALLKKLLIRFEQPLEDAGGGGSQRRRGVESEVP